MSMTQSHESNASIMRPKGFSLPTWFMHHIQAASGSLARLFRTPFSSVMTICVIGVALALPATFLVLINNVRSVHHGLDNSTRISLYLHTETSRSDIDNLLTDLKSRSDVMDVRYISKEEGLEEFTKQSGFHDVLSRLPENPLPPVIEVFPSQMMQAQSVEELLEHLQQLPQVEIAKLDMQWVKRLQAILELGQQVMTALLLLFFAAVVLVIGNTIRMQISQQRREIEVIKLIGGTNAFIRRPFLHTGLLYGLFGGLVAALFVQTLVLFLDGPVVHLAKLYESGFTLTGLNLGQVIGLLLASMLLGLLGAWIAVQRQLSSCEPR